MSLKMLNHYEFDRLKNCLLYCCTRGTTRTFNYLLVEPRGFNSLSCVYFTYRIHVDIDEICQSGR